MIAAFATLAFLTAIWLVAVVVAQAMAESGNKIVAALIGRSQMATVTNPILVPVRISQRSFRLRPSLRAQPKWRAAA